VGGWVGGGGGSFALRFEGGGAGFIQSNTIRTLVLIPQAVAVLVSAPVRRRPPVRALLAVPEPTRERSRSPAGDGVSVYIEPDHNANALGGIRARHAAFVAYGKTVLLHHEDLPAIIANLEVRRRRRSGRIAASLRAPLLIPPPLRDRAALTYPRPRVSPVPPPRTERQWTSRHAHTAARRTMSSATHADEEVTSRFRDNGVNRVIVF
jgi:hypothetical protein